MTLLFLILGLVLLVVGAELLVKGASQLATAMGISPLIIGLTIVACGTSTPEMVVSIMSGLTGQADIALGNVIGSNVFNILLILGISALITPLVVSQQLLRFDVPLMVGISILVLILGYDGQISRIDGFLLFASFISYTLFLIRQSKKENKELTDERAEHNANKMSRQSWIKNSVSIIVGLGLLVLGAQWLVNSAITIAQQLGVSELIIGLTIVAIGTSLPEVATSIIASMRGERDIAVGNVIGSNIFNILAVLGLSSIVAPDGIHVSPAAKHFDILVMIGATVACLPIFFTGNVIARWEGALFLGYYIAYTLYLILAASQHTTLQSFKMAMVWFVMPLTAITLILITIRAMRAKSKIE